MLGTVTYQGDKVLPFMCVYIVVGMWGSLLGSGYASVGVRATKSRVARDDWEGQPAAEAPPMRCMQYVSNRINTRGPPRVR